MSNYSTSGFSARGRLVMAFVIKLYTGFMVYKTAKRILDILFGLIGTIFLLPLTIIVYTANVLTGDFHSPFLLQKRIGKDGRMFTMIKFRSMVVGAEQKLAELMKTNKRIKAEYEKNKKLKNDPRITKVGAVIRKYSIDEMPQFLNVLIGNMSVVGNRPYLPGEKKEIPSKLYKEIIKTKPGITGLWQVSGHNDVSFKDRLEVEALYSEIACMSVDMRIFFKTFSAMFGCGEKR